MPLSKRFESFGLSNMSCSSCKLVVFSSWMKKKIHVRLADFQLFVVKLKLTS